MKVCIALDIDNTLCNTAAALEQYFGPREIGTYRIPGADEKFFREHPLIYLKAKPMPGSISGSRKLGETADIVYITKRPGTLLVRIITKLFLRLYGYPKGPVIYEAVDKGPAALQHNVTLAIDDKDMAEYEQVGIRSLMIPWDYNTSETKYARYSWPVKGD